MFGCSGASVTVLDLDGTEVSGSKVIVKDGPVLSIPPIVSVLTCVVTFPTSSTALTQICLPLSDYLVTVANHSVSVTVT